MRDINFIEVGMENFGPYIEEMVLPFDNDKLTLITGPNGIGKTMSLEALPFTLFGETCKKAKGDDVVNTRVGKNCHTWVKFAINEDVYLVNRYHKYKSLGNTVLIQKNGEEPYLKGHREVLPEIEKLICSKKSFTNTLMFGQKVKDFFTDLVDSDKKEIFRKILDLDIYTTWYKEADLDLKAIKEKIQRVLEQAGIDSGVLSTVNNQIEILFKQKNDFEKQKKDKIEAAKKSIEDSQRLLEGWENDRSKGTTTQEDLDKIQLSIDDYKTQIQHHENEKNTNILKLHSSRDAKKAELIAAGNAAKEAVVRENRKRMEEILEQHNAEIQKITDEFNKINTSISSNDSQLSSIATEKRITITEITKLNSSFDLSGVCPTCLREIDDECKEHLQTELNSLNDKKYILDSQEETLQTQQVKLESKLTEIKKKKQDIDNSLKIAKNNILTTEEDQLVDIGNKMGAALDKVDSLAEDQEKLIAKDYEEYITLLNKKLNDALSIKEVIKDTLEKLKEIDKAITGLQQDIKRYEYTLKLAEEEEYDVGQLAAYQMQKQQLEKAIEESKVKHNELKAEEELASFWKAAWSPTGIPSMLIDESIPFMNKKVSQYLDRLSNGRYIVSFDTLAETKAGEFRDKISVNVLDTYTRANSRIQLSGGQTRLVDIATILTLGDLQSNIQDVNINILLFDEIFDSLDEENIGFVANILNQLKIGKSIYLISHTQVDQLEADEILELK
jgi:exonuclease SbcC